jgi:N-acetyl-gamma-glutamyl-phosphate reductase
MTTTAHVVGATGYAAAELVRLLAAHPDVTIATLESSSAAGARMCDIFPSLPAIEIVCSPTGSVRERVRPGDVVFLAGNHEVAREHAPALLAAGARVIDLSDAYRLAERAEGAVYGLPERYRDQIARSSFIANPGCYVTTALLALIPLGPLGKRIATVIVDAKSGVTGAGRNPKVQTLFGEVAEDVFAYGLEGHRHQPEIVQEARAAGIDAPIVFSPHVVPLRRGIFADVYLVPSAPIAREEVEALCVRFYAGNPFVTVLTDKRVPHLPAVEKTNNAQLKVAQRDGVIHILSALDNLGKGAAGQAVQNMNIMLGLPEERGLDARTAVG